MVTEQAHGRDRRRHERGGCSPQSGIIDDSYAKVADQEVVFGPERKAEIGVYWDGAPVLSLWTVVVEPVAGAGLAEQPHCRYRRYRRHSNVACPRLHQGWGVGRLRDGR